MRALVLGVATLALSAGAASAQAPTREVYPGYGYAPYGYSYAAPGPLYGYAAPAYGYRGPAYGYGYAAPGPLYGYAAPAYGATGGQPPKRVQTGQQLPQQPQW